MCEKRCGNGTKAGSGVLRRSVVEDRWVGWGCVNLDSGPLLYVEQVGCVSTKPVIASETSRADTKEKHALSPLRAPRLDARCHPASGRARNDLTVLPDPLPVSCHLGGGGGSGGFQDLSPRAILPVGIGALLLLLRRPLLWRPAPKTDLGTAHLNTDCQAIASYPHTDTSDLLARIVRRSPADSVRLRRCFLWRQSGIRPPRPT